MSVNSKGKIVVLQGSGKPRKYVLPVVEKKPVTKKESAAKEAPVKEDSKTNG